MARQPQRNQFLPFYARNSNPGQNSFYDIFDNVSYSNVGDMHKSLSQYFKYGSGNSAVNTLTEFLVSQAGSKAAKTGVRNIVQDPTMRTLFGSIATDPSISRLFGGSTYDVFRSASTVASTPLFSSDDGGRVFATQTGAQHLIKDTTEFVDNVAIKNDIQRGHAAGLLRAGINQGAFKGATLTSDGVDEGGFEVFNFSDKMKDKIEKMTKAGNDALKSLKELFGDDKSDSELMSLASQVTGEAFKTVEGARELKRKINDIRLGAEDRGFDTAFVGQTMDRMATKARKMGMSAENAGFLANQAMRTGLSLTDKGANLAGATTQAFSVTGQIMQSRDYDLQVAGRGFLATNKIQDPEKREQLEQALENNDTAKISSIISNATNGQASLKQLVSAYRGAVSDTGLREALLAVGQSEKVTRNRINEFITSDEIAGFSSSANLKKLGKKIINNPESLQRFQQINQKLSNDSELSEADETFLKDAGLGKMTAGETEQITSKVLMSKFLGLLIPAVKSLDGVDNVNAGTDKKRTKTEEPVGKKVVDAATGKNRESELTKVIDTVNGVVEGFDPSIFNKIVNTLEDIADNLEKDNSQSNKKDDD